MLNSIIIVIVIIVIIFIYYFYYNNIINFQIDSVIPKIPKTCNIL